MPARSSPTKILKAKDAGRALRKLADPKKAKILSSFFKTAPGQYGHGDVFLGVVVPNTRRTARVFKDLSVNETVQLLRSNIHEQRLLALLILVEQFRDGNEEKRQEIYDLYLNNTKHINNWDLVDLSAYHIVGGYLFEKDRSPLIKLAKSPVLWERRIAVLATFYYIKNYDFKDTLRIAEILLKDKHDLIHKAAGWMLREVGKRDLAMEEGFLKKHYKSMPRTMLRYAIEKFEEEKRKKYLTGLV